MSETKNKKAIDLLKSNKSVSERAVSFEKSIKRNIQREVLDEITQRKETIEDSLFELADFSLDVDLNKGNARMTKNECEDRFKKIIDLEYELKLVEIELETKQSTFDKYFG